MTREEMDQAVKDIHQYFVDRKATYGECISIIHHLEYEYEQKKIYTINNMSIDDVAKTKISYRKVEKLF